MRRARERLFSLGLGVIVTLVLLEVGLRVGGAAWLGLRDAKNQAAMNGAADIVILCLGESTTAFGDADAWPAQLERVLEERTSRAFTVINGGIPSTNTSVLVSQLPQNLDRYHPAIVAAMMGANDAGDAIPFAASPEVKPPGLLEHLRLYRVGVLLLSDLFHPAGDRAAEAVAPVPTGPGKPPPANPSPDGKGPPSRKPKVDCGPETAGLMDRGVRAEQAGHFEESDALFQQIVDKSPRCSDAWIRLAASYERRQDVTGAEALFRKAIAADPTGDFAWFGLGRILWKQDRCEEARQVILEGLKYDDTNSRAWEDLGTCDDKLGRADEAEQALLHSLTLDPHNKRGWVRLIDFYEDTKQDSKVREIAPKAAADNPTNADILGRFALYFHRTGDPTEEARYDQLARAAQSQGYHPITRDNYLQMQRILGEQHIPLIAVQYATRDVDALKALFPDPDGVFFVDNGPSFRDALSQRPYADLFWDNCYGDFGHCTAAGNRMLAENVAGVILEQVMK